MPPLVVLATAWLILIVYAFPGQMSQDSFDHLREARGGVYTDGHPPAINLLWKLVDGVIAGPFGMLVLQSVGMVAGLYALLRRGLAARPAAWIAAAVFVFPPVLMPFAMIWKDCFMAAFLVLGIAGLWSARRSVRVLGLVAMFGATAVRYNAVAATLPLIVLLFEWRPGMWWLRRYALALTAWVVVTGAAFGINAAITDKQMHIWHSSLAVYDIVGTLAFVEQDLPDAELRARLAGTEVRADSAIHARARAVYSPRNFAPIIHDAERALWHLPVNGFVPAPQAQRDAIGRAWWDTITGHPVAYLQHRLAVMAEVIALPPRRRAAGAVTSRTMQQWIESQGRGETTRWSALQLAATDGAAWIAKHTPIFAPWIYILISLILIPLALRQRDVLALVLSGLAFEAALLVLAPSRDYRYSHWMIVCTLLALILWFTARARARAAGSTASR